MVNKKAKSFFSRFQNKSRNDERELIRKAGDKARLEQKIRFERERQRVITDRKLGQLKSARPLTFFPAPAPKKIDPIKLKLSINGKGKKKSKPKPKGRTFKQDLDFLMDF